MRLKTPYYLIDERALLKNLKIIQAIRLASGAKFLLALKCFSSWGVFDLMKQYLDGTTSSSLYEVRLGREKFGKETHAYSVAYSRDEVIAATRYADTVIFNSITQLKRFHRLIPSRRIGLRVNPGVSYSHFDLADPARRFSRLGVTGRTALQEALPLISGIMFHFNCENSNFNAFSGHLAHIATTYGTILKKLEWVSLGGGIHFTGAGYPVTRFARALRDFSSSFDVQVYLEPGEAVITQSTELITTVLDIVHNKKDVAIIDASTEAHMLDVLIYRISAKIPRGCQGPFSYIIAGRSCLAGDIFGTYRFKTKLHIGSRIRIADAAGYTMVKKNWFNGLIMPSIAVRRLNGTTKVIRNFTYNNFVDSVS
ncbi:MAG: carboxynorspermidine decarboxylase [Candidatus Omnitrophica bacterium]|nr:carboxynorspermidine decarboxylase [Candidatus Omnitrophota bacterium]